MILWRGEEDQLPGSQLRFILQSQLSSQFHIPNLTNPISIVSPSMANMFGGMRFYPFFVKQHNIYHPLCQENHSIYRHFGL